MSQILSYWYVGLCVLLVSLARSILGIENNPYVKNYGRQKLYQRFKWKSKMYLLHRRVPPKGKLLILFATLACFSPLTTPVLAIGGIIAPIRNSEIGVGGLNIERFGGSASAADNTTAFNNTVAALPVRGGRVYIPAGQWLFTGEPSIKGKTGLIIEGAGGRSGALIGGGTEGATVLQYQGTGSTRFFDMRQAKSCALVQLDIMSNSKKLKEAPGYVVDMELAQEPFIENVTTECTGTAAEIFACRGWFLQKSNSGVFINCNFKACEYGVVGLFSEAVTFSAAHKFYTPFFLGQRVNHILNPGQQWSLYGPIFEPLGNIKGENTNFAGAIKCIEGYSISNLDIYGIWAGGAEEKGTQIEWQGEGLTISGGYIANAANGISLIKKFSNIQVSVQFQKVTTCFVPTEAITGKPAKVNCGYSEVTTPVFEPARLFGAYTAKTARAVATPFVASTEGQTYVVLNILTKELTKTIVEIVVGGVVIAEQEVSATVAGQNKLTEQILVPQGIAWEVKVKEGTVESMTSSYLNI